MFIKKGLSSLIICSLVLLLKISVLAGGRNPEEYLEKRKLVEKLLSNYNKSLKPAGQVNIKFALNLNQINRVRSKDQVFELNTFVDHEWVDPRLRWDPAQNNNISVLRIACEKLWTPDTYLYTTAEKNGFILPHPGALVVVESSGRIYWPNPRPQMQVRCRMSIAWFPFDEQICTIIFGSWSITVNSLNYTTMSYEKSLNHQEKYQENSEWTVVAMKPFRYEVTYDNWVEPYPFSEIHYKILIRRKPLFILFNYVIPPVMLLCITLISFYAPYAQESQVGISIILTYAVIKLRLSDDVPSQSDCVPLINIYYIGCMFISLCSLLWFSITNYYRTFQQKLPQSSKWIVKHIICPVMRKKVYKPIKIEPDESDIQKDSHHLHHHHHDLTNLEMVEIMNDFVFWIFVVFEFLLNFVLLVFLPLFVKKPLAIE